MRTSKLERSSKSENEAIFAVLATAALFCLLTSSCGGGGESSSPPPSNPVPSITGLSPSSATAGAAGQTLTINGTNFLSSSTATYNGVAHAATFVSSTQLTISLSASDQATAGSYAVVVTNPSPGGGPSNSVNFTVNPAPTITSVSVACSLAAILMTQTSTCTATVQGTGAYSSAVTWSATDGTITSAGVFTPTSSGTATITATSTGDNTKSGTAQVAVATPTALVINITDLASGALANVTVTDPNGLQTTLTSSRIMNAIPGTYTITAAPVVVGTSTYNATAPTQTATVTSGNSTMVTVDYRNVAPATTKVLDSEAETSLSVSSDGLTLTMSASSPVAQSLVAGDVIIVSPTSADGVAPKGMLRQVLSVSSNASQVVATTQQGTLAEAFQRASFQIQTQLASSTIQAVRTHPGVTFQPGASFHRAGNGRKPLSPSDSLSDPCGGYSLGVFDVTQPIQVDAVPGLILSGSVEVCSGLNFSVDIIGTGFLGLVPTVNSLTATVSMGAYSDLSLQGDFLSGSFDSEPITLATLDFPPIDVPGLPVWVTPEVSVFVGANGNLSAGITTEVSAAGSYTGGVTYASGAWSPVPLTPSFQFGYQPPTLNAGLSAKAYAGIEFDLYVYDVVGPSFKPDGYLDLEASLIPNPSWTLTGGLEGPMSLDVTFLGETLASYDLGSMFNYSDVIASSTFSPGSSNPVPSITSLSPSSLTVSAAPQNLTINGTGFLSNSTVTFKGIAHTPTFVSSTQLTISLTASDLATAGSFPVVVTNPAPGGGTSNAVNLTVGNPLPVITSLSPSSLTVGAAPQTLTINGTGFLPNSTMTFNGIAQTLTFVSSTQLTISLTASDLAAAGTFPVVVTNPAPGGGASNTVDFVVQPAGTQANTAILVTDSNGQLWSTGAMPNDIVLIGSLPAVMSDIAAYNGTLYGISLAPIGGYSTLYSLNPSSGSGTVIGSGTGAVLNALAFSPSGTLYAAGGDSLYAVDLTAGTATQIGSGSGAGAYTSSGDVEFDSSGRLYLTSYGASSDQLFAVDPATGRGTLIGNIGYSQVYGLAYFNGVMYGFTGTGAVISINLATGAGTPVTSYNLQFTGATALAPVPTWTQKFPTTSPSQRIWHATAYDSSRGQVVLFGGCAGTTVLGDTWVWDGTNWTQKFPTTSPPARMMHAMAFDSARGQVVLFGGVPSFGNIGNSISDTWVWDGTNWTQKFPTTSPPARAEHAMAYDAVREQVVLTGGLLANLVNPGPLMDTWVWDGATWTQKTPTNSPPRRIRHAMAFDAAKGNLVLFGGLDFFASTSTLFGDSWVWDGTNWSEAFPAISPAARASHAMAYDEAEGLTVLFGGATGTTALGDVLSGDTWTWDGTAWSQFSPPTSPGAREDHAMTYDSARAQVVLFAGQGGCPGGQCADTWVWGP